jgi:aminopeptidase YwaD
MSYLQGIASADQQVRRHEIMAILREIDCDFAHYRERVGRYRPENIVVSIGEGFPKLVLGAHYDSVPGSSGANDNAAAVSILLEVIQRVRETSLSIPVNVVFFDLEEGPMAGSQAYVARLSPQDVLAMINLDLCGFGDTLVVAPQKHIESRLLNKAVLNASHGRQVEVLEASPPSDDMIFEYVGIPNISVCVAPADDVELLAKSAAPIHGWSAPEAFPSVFDTMHNRSRDSIEFVELTAMQQCLDWTLTFVREFGT